MVDLRTVRKVKTDDVRSLEELIQLHILDFGLCNESRIPIRIAGEHLHLKRGQEFNQALSYSSEPNQPDRTVTQKTTHGLLPVTATDRAVYLRNPAQGCQHGRQRQL